MAIMQLGIMNNSNGDNNPDKCVGMYMLSLAIDDADDNGSGLRISWHLGTGSNFTSSNTALTWTNYADAGWAYGHAQNGVLTTDNATWLLTGVQFEVGEVATPFEYETFADNLQKCKRYFQTLG